MAQNDNADRAGATTRRVNHKSDFSFLLGFGGDIPSWPPHDWKAVFFTPASRVATFTASVIGGVAVNCFDDGGRVHVVARRHGLPPGPLLCELIQWLPDDVFPDGTRREVTPVLKGTGVELVEGPGDGATGIEVELTVPYAVIDAYMTARAAGFGGTMEEYYAGLAMLPSLAALVADLAAGKAAVAAALTRRGYATEKEDAMADMAATIDAMGLTSVDFAALGYTETPRAVRDAVDYALARAAEWDPDDPSAAGFFKDDTALLFAPTLDCSHKTNAYRLFYGCSKLLAVPELNLPNATNVSSLFYGCSSLLEVPELNLPNATDASDLFSRCSSLVTVPPLDLPNATKANGIFYYCRLLVTAPPLDLPSATDVSYLFCGCSSLVKVPELNLPNATNISSLFEDCVKLTEAPPLDLPNVTNAEQPFYGCTNLTKVPELSMPKAVAVGRLCYNCKALTDVPPLDLPNATRAWELFYGCSSLVEAPELNLPSATSAYGIFRGCSSLVSVPPLDLPKATDVSYLFCGCSSLVSVPPLDLPSATNVSSLFSGCSSLAEVPGLNMPKATNVSSLFSGCSSLAEVPGLNMPKATNVSSLFSGCQSLEYIPDLGKSRFTSLQYMFSICTALKRVERLSYANISSQSSQSRPFRDCHALVYLLIEGVGTLKTAITYDLNGTKVWGSGSEENRRSLVDSLLTLSFDRTAAGYAASTIKLHADTAARLTAEEIAAITAKGFTITTTTSTI